MKLKITIILFTLTVSALCAAAPYEGPMTSQAIKFGSLNCLDEIRVVDKFLNEASGPNGASSVAPNSSPEKRLYASLNIKKYDDGTWGYDMLNVTPGPKGCDGTLVRVVTFPNKSCSSVRETTYKDYTYSASVVGKAVYEKGNTTAILEDLTGSCVVVHYEAMFPIPKQ